MSSYVLLAVFSVMLSSFSQVILKKSSGEEKENVVKEYLNIKVLGAYGITFICLLLTTFALKGIDYKYISAIEATSYAFIMVFSKLFLKEKLTKKKVIGNIIIIAGVIVFSLSF